MMDPFTFHAIIALSALLACLAVFLCVHRPPKPLNQAALASVDRGILYRAG
jgi:hypothetical protein